MASIVRPSGEPRYCPMIFFDMEKERAFLSKYLKGWTLLLKESYDPDEVPKRAFLQSGHKCVADFVAI